MFSISSFEIINVAVPDPKIFLRIPMPAADTAAVSPNGIKTLSVDGLRKFFINDKPVFINGPKSVQEIHLIVLFQKF